MQRNFIPIFQVFILLVYTFAADLPNTVRYHIFLSKRNCSMPTIDEPSFQFSQRYRLCCQQPTRALRFYENTPLSASLQLCEK